MQKVYDASSIDVLEGLDPVRLRPSMYIGNVGVTGLHHLVYEVVDNSIDESMAGYCNEINVILYSDNSISVEDNGRGIPVGIHKSENVPAVEVVLTKLHSGGKFNSSNYKISGGLHGVGVSVVNALSEKLIAKIYYNGNIYYQKFCKGKKISELKKIGKTSKTGTKIHFLPDKKIFHNNIKCNFEILSRRFRELAFLNNKVKIIFEDKIRNKKQSFFFIGGLSSFVKYINKNSVTIHEPILICGNKKNIKIKISIQYNNTYRENIFSFANNINTNEGGTHLVGFKSGLTRTINQYAIKEKLIKNSIDKIKGVDSREGLSAVINVKLKSPQFEGQTKTKLGNSEVKGYVESLTSEQLTYFFEKNPSIAKKILSKSLEAARARNAAKKARDLSRNKGSLNDHYLPGKLAECQVSEAEKRELFLVEGDSASGSAKQGRDRKFQAILPLKGKILNVEKSRIDKVLNNEQIRNIISVIGTGISEEEFDIVKVRYHKVIIMTDADVDGSHIRTLLLTFFYRHMINLIQNGFLYIAQPPLYKVGNKKNIDYINSEEELDDFIFKKISNKYKVFLNNDINKLQNNKLGVFFENVKVFFDELLRIKKKGFSKEIVKILIHLRVKNKDFLKNKKKMKILKKTFDKNGYKTNRLFWNKEMKTFEIKVFQKKTFFFDLENENKNIINKNIVYFSSFQKCLNIWQKIKFMIKPPFKVISRNNNYFSIAENVEDLKENINLINNRSFQIQRYKGLGEMNPDQLWETTMNPRKRNLLKVVIDDLVASNEIFSILMGDEVEPRRKFIQNNALEAINLDF